MEIDLKTGGKIFWLDGFQGQAKGGAYYRSKIAIDIEEFEEKFNEKVVAIGIEKDYKSEKASWNVEMITEVWNEKEKDDE